MIKALPIVAFMLMVFSACAVVDITKTGKGYFEPSNSNEIEILKTRPEKSYEELGVVTALKFKPHHTAKMHNAIRVKAAQLGANAVILTEEGITADLAGSPVGRWANGVAIRYK